MPIQQPSNQIKLTNVSIVRLKKSGKRFEIACYKNKVQEWRNGVEKNQDDVLQISNVFMNVSKGEVAKSNDLKKAFGTTSVDDVVKEILEKGEVQVGEKERDHDLASLRKEIATLVAEKCVDPGTQRPYPVGMIEKAMAEAGVSVKAGKNAKSQVAETLRLIQSNSTLPIQRARMRVRVVVPAAEGERLQEQLLALTEKVEKQDKGESWETVMLIEPSRIREINELLQKECKGKGRVETLTFAATADSS
ncbi:Shwachman-Bodian-diamond syndrome protein [Rhizopogon vinicolor AM-OR11-026]|uniref:Ribosome maturation protein SDO1 n=1 Tax=Rhizopogon vinicolor AM-OR11-026 TaxID=1314800 RepID=A0A1B7NFU0_9AGAM|nr:Shwachman-Bodian-diamond syndrome protein [Rhizopogon vinicolor AM-OR11-026]